MKKQKSIEPKLKNQSKEYVWKFGRRGKFAMADQKSSRREVKSLLRRMA